MYPREYGDDLCSEDKRLTYKWEWCRMGADVPERELKKWTHFQVSEANYRDWKMEAIQWSESNEHGVDYEARISYRDNEIEYSRHHKTRLDAQLAAELLLLDWIQKNMKLSKK